MKDVFNRTVTYGGGHSTDGVSLAFSGVEAGTLAQNLQIQYAQEINRVWELGSTNAYFLGGRTSGTFQIDKVSGPRQAADLLKKFGDLCAMRSNTLSFSYQGGWCEARGGNRGSTRLNHVVIQSMTKQVAAQDMVFNENLQGLFASLTE